MTTDEFDGINGRRNRFNGSKIFFLKFDARDGD